MIKKASAVKSFVFPKIQGRQGVQQRGHRDYVGGLWNEIGQLQYEFLKDVAGVKPSDVLLDIACGSFRLGSLMIPYLDAGHYLGIEIEGALIERGKDEIGAEVWEEKRPEIVIDGEFHFERFSKKPDICLAQSLFTHLHPGDIAKCFNNLRSFCQRDTTLYATFFECKQPKRYQGLFKSHPHRNFKYTTREIENLAQGWNFEYLGDWGHPWNQKMLRLWI